MRIAAIGRIRHSAQDRGRGWVDLRGNVGIPSDPGTHDSGGVVAVGQAVLGDRINLGIALVVPAEDDMDGRRRAEPAREGDMPGVIEALIFRFPRVYGCPPVSYAADEGNA